MCGHQTAAWFVPETRQRVVDQPEAGAAEAQERRANGCTTRAGTRHIAHQRHDVLQNSGAGAWNQSAFDAVVKEGFEGRADRRGDSGFGEAEGANIQHPVLCRGVWSRRGRRRTNGMRSGFSARFLTAAVVLSVLSGWYVSPGAAQTAPLIIEPTPGLNEVDDFEHTLRVGQEISITFAAQTTGKMPPQPQAFLNSNPDLGYDPEIWRLDEPYFPTIEVDQDPGMPNAAVVTPGEFKKTLNLDPLDNRTLSPAKFENSLTWTWVPTCDQISTYKMHMSIFNQLGRRTKKFILHIVKPDPEVVEYVNQTRHARVGCPISLYASARDRDNMTRFMGLPGYAMVWSLKMTRIDLRGARHAMAEIPGAEWQQLPERNDWNGTSAIFEWTPIRGQEGSTYEICFHMQDSCEATPKQTFCTNITVVKCQMCIHAGHTLQSLAAEYKTDYLALYSMNVAIPNPDRIPRGTLVNTGIKYKVREGDSLFSIAERFFSTVDHILNINPDIRDDSDGNELLMGDKLCLLPPLCSVKCERGIVCSLVEKQSAGISSF